MQILIGLMTKFYIYLIVNCSSILILGKEKYSYMNINYLFVFLILKPCTLTLSEAKI